MQNLKFFSLLRTLTQGEVSAFQKYLKQMHGGDDVAMKVFEYSKKVYPNLGDTKKLDLVYAYRKIFGTSTAEEKINRKKMLNTLSDLHLWLKDFLLWEKACSDSWESQVLWLGILQDRGLEEQLARHTTRFYEETIAQPHKGSGEYIQDLSAAYLQYQNICQNKSLDIQSMQQCLHTLDTAAEIIRLRISCEMANRRNVRASETISLTTPATFMQERVAGEVPFLLEIYRKIYQLIESKEEIHYTRIVEILAENSQNIESNELQNIHTYLRNYIAFQSRTKTNETSKFVEKMHQLNQFSVQYGIFSQVGKMSDTQFANIVNIACTQKDFNWAEAFVSEQSHLLPPDIQHETVLLAKAIILFEQNKFKEVLRHLESKEFRNIHYIIRSRSLVLRTYYESGEAADKIIDYYTLFDALLRRQKPKTDAIVATRAFVRLFKLMFLQETDKQNLLDQINAETNLYLKTWLLKHAAVYKQKYATPKRNK